MAHLKGRTAWRTQPLIYFLLMGSSLSYLGYPAIPNDADVTAIYEKANSKQLAKYLTMPMAMARRWIKIRSER